MSERQGMTQQETTNKSNQTSHSTQNSKQTQYDQEHKDQSDSGALERIIADPFAASAKDMLTMQGVLGNRILGHIIQAKLTVGTAGNHYEQEADRVAEQVIKQTAAATPSNLNITSKKPAITPFVHSTPAAMTSSDETSTQGFEVAHNWESRLKTSKNTGSPLPDNTRHLMESQMGADFSQVRVHTGFAAAHLNQEINAEAFTHGNDIYMADGRYQPQSQSGQQLLAHELTHVVQQSAHSDGQQSPTVQRNWLSRLFSRKKKNHESEPAPQPSSTATATPPPTIKWAGAQSSAASRPARPSIGTSRVPQRPAPDSETSIDPAPRTPPADSHYLPGGFDQIASRSGSDSGTYTTPVADDHASDSGTYTTPVAEDRAPGVSTPAPRNARLDSHYLPGGFDHLGSSSGSDSGSYTTPVAEEHASDSGTYTTPVADDRAPGVSTPAPRNARPDSHYLPGGFDHLGSSSGSDSGTYTTPVADDHAPGVSTPAPRVPRPDSHYLPGGFDHLGSSSSSSSGSGAYMTPEEHAPVPRSATPPRTTPSPSSSAPAAPAFTMPKLAKFDDETEQQGFWGSRGGAPTYYQPQDQPNPYELEIQDGRFQHKGGELLDTQNILPYQRLKDKAHRHMFTMGGQGELHSADVGHGMAEHGRVHHTTMSGGRETAAAGELRVNQGKLETVSDASGHYMPGTAQTYQALENFASRGVDLSATNVELTGKEEGQRALSLSATELMAYKPEMDEAIANARNYRQLRPLEEGNKKKRARNEMDIRDILSAPEQKIRTAHAKKDTMLEELRQSTADRRKHLDDSSAPAQQGRRDLSLFEYEEEMRGYDQASSSQSNRMTPAQAKQAQQELREHMQEQERRRRQQ